MEIEVLVAAVICVAGFIAWRLLASSKEENVNVGFQIFILTIVGYTSHASIYGDWLWVGLALLFSYFSGFAGKDTLRTFMRKKACPKIRAVVGRWNQEATASEDDHHQYGP